MSCIRAALAAACPAPQLLACAQHAEAWCNMRLACCTCDRLTYMTRKLVAVQRLRILGLEHMPYPGLAAEMVRISEDGIRQAGEIRRREEPVPEAEYQVAPRGGPGAPKGGGRGRKRTPCRGRHARREAVFAARGPGGGGHHLVDEADEADPIPEGVHGLVHPQPFQAGDSSPGDSPTFTPTLLLAKIPGSSSQPSQNAYMEKRDNVDWAALRTSLADERPVRNLQGARILDFDEFLIPDSTPAGPPEPPTQAFSHGSAEPAVSSHMITEPQVSFLLKFVLFNIRSIFNIHI
ncbi:uncharacterized protein LOC132066126 [Lycium ferocissimum]|uniref:uncharacterized protein LOC132066126 n=1 Tax=Lycium ferocissimum TaxID=112874 RepID=UPI002816145E|nr:uncharacterized protein LOC132066126 [Lycium ferocissimum]